MKFSFLRIQITDLLCGPLFTVSCIVTFALSYGICFLNLPAIAAYRVSLWEVITYTLSNFGVFIFGYALAFLICGKVFSPPQKRDAFFAARMGGRNWALSRIIALSIQAMLCACLAALGAFIAALGQVSWTNDWANPGLFLVEESANMYYMDSALFNLPPLAAAFLQCCLFAGYLFTLGLVAFVAGLSATSNRVGLIAAIVVHFTSLVIYYVPSKALSLLSLYNSYFLYEYHDNDGILNWLKMALMLVGTALLIALSLRKMRRYKWHRLIEERI